MPLGLLLGMSGFGGTAIAVPDAPTSFAVSLARTIYGELAFSWVAPAGSLTSYTIEKSLAGADSWTTFETFAAPATSRNISMVGLTADTNYDYRIKATNAGGTGAASSTVTKYTPVVYDSFTGTADTNLTAHTPDIGSVAYSGYGTPGHIYELDGAGLCRVDNTSTTLTYGGTTGLADATTRARITATSADTGIVGILFRYSNSSNYAILYRNFSNNRFYCYKNVAGVLTNIFDNNTLAGGTLDTYEEIYVTVSGTGANNLTAGVYGVGSIGPFTLNALGSNTGVGPATFSDSGSTNARWSDLVQGREIV